MLYRLFRFLFRLLFYGLYRLEVSGREHVPSDGPLVLCGNHTSLLDPPLLGTPLKRMVHFMAKEELFRIPVLGWFITRFGAFPVKRGGVSKESIRFAIRALKDGKAMGIFPEGSRKNQGGMGKKGAAMLALRSQATVIPVAIIGNYRPFQRLKIIYGKPVDLSDFSEGTAEMLEAATERIMEAIRQMIANDSK